jgi:hypothetical protein
MTEPGTASPDEGRVVVARLHDPGNSENGAEETVLARGAEAEARRVYADTVATAGEAGYAYVTLRSGGADVETWPQLTGWTL